MGCWVLLRQTYLLLHMWSDGESFPAKIFVMWMKINRFYIMWFYLQMRATQGWRIEPIWRVLLIVIIIIIIILMPRQCLWCCHHGRVIARVRPVHLMNVERRQAAAEPRPSQTTYAVSPPVQADTVFIHHRRLLLLLSQKANTHLPSHSN